MAKTLISFLGAVAGPHAYPKTVYRFPDGGTYEASLFAHALQQQIGADRLIVLGTETSMWNHLVEDIEEQSGELYELSDEFRERSRKAIDASTADLAPLEAWLIRKYELPIALALIPAGFTGDQQVGILKTLEALVSSGDVIVFDVTHGYRHLPMVAVAAAQYLQSAKPDITVEGLWYGALDQPGSRTGHAVDLTEMLRIFKWTLAVQRLDLIGDFGAMEDLVDRPGIVEKLQDAAFLEATHQDGYQKQLVNVRSELERDPLTGPASLFQDALLDRIKWINGSPESRYWGRATAALDRGDLLRAGLYAYEAYVTRLTGQAEGDRDKAIAWIKEEAMDPAVVRLKSIRNRLAHGDEGRKHKPVEALFNSREALAAELRSCIAQLNKQPKP